MREIRSSGSVEGVISDGHSYSDSCVAALRGSLRHIGITSVGMSGTGWITVALNWTAKLQK